MKQKFNFAASWALRRVAHSELRFAASCSWQVGTFPNRNVFQAAAEPGEVEQNFKSN